MARVRTDVAVEEANGRGGEPAAREAEGKVFPYGLLRIAHAVDGAAIGAGGVERDCFDVRAKPVAACGKREARLPTIERVVVPVTDERADAGSLQAVEAGEKSQLGGEAPIGTIVDVTSNEKRIDSLRDADVDDPVVGTKGCRQERFADVWWGAVFEAFERAIEVEIGSVDEAEWRQAIS